MESIYTPSNSPYVFSQAPHQPLTLAMVITGDNDLDDLAWGDTKELRRGLRNLPDDIAVTIFSDRKDDKRSGWAYYRGGDEANVKIPEPNTNDPFYLEEFLKWSYVQTQVVPHGFIFWGHSDGGICIGPDDNPLDSHSPGITSVELAKVFKKTQIIPMTAMFDCCLSSQLLSYNTLEKAGVKFFSGAGTSVYDSGNRYDNFFKYLSKDITPAELVAHFTNSYPESLLREEPVIRVAAYANTREITQAVSALVQTITPRDLMYSGKYLENIEDSNNVDLADLITLGDPALQEYVIQTILSSRIVERYCGDKTGLNIWLPTNEFNHKELAYWEESLDFPQEYQGLMVDVAENYSNIINRYITKLVRALV